MAEQAMAGFTGSAKQRMQAVEDLAALLQAGQQLTREQLHVLVDASGELLADPNNKTAQATLEVLATLIKTVPEAMRPYVNVLVPLVVERLGHARQPVRQKACEVLLNLLEVMPIPQMLERMSRFWNHHSWKVKHGLLQTVAEAVSLHSARLLSSQEQNEHIITSVVNLLEDRHESVRSAAHDCLQELYKVLKSELLDSLQQQSMRPAVLREVVLGLDAIKLTGINIADLGTTSSSRPAASQHADTAGSSPHQSESGGPTGPTPARVPPRATVSAGGPRPGGQSAVGAGPAPVPPASPVLVSERELAAEAAAMVVPLNGTVVDWQQRIGHMHRLQGLALGCAVTGGNMLDCLVDALKVLREPLTKQLEDRRSAVEKQACAVLSIAAQSLGLRFQEHLVYFLPVLFRILPITVQVMTEAADACCLALLTHCPSSRGIPPLAGAVAKDKNSKIRTCCATYLVNVLESWDASVWLKCTEDVEVAMKAACQDACGAVRSEARKMFVAYQLYAPDVAAAFARRLDPAILDKLNRTPGDTGAAANKRAALPKPFLSRAGSATSLASSIGGGDHDIILVAAPRPVTAGASLHSGNGRSGLAASTPAVSAGTFPLRTLAHGSSCPGSPSSRSERPPAGRVWAAAGPGRHPRLPAVPQGGPERDVQIGLRPHAQAHAPVVTATLCAHVSGAGGHMFRSAGVPGKMSAHPIAAATETDARCRDTIGVGLSDQSCREH